MANAPVDPPMYASVPQQVISAPPTVVLGSPNVGPSPIVMTCPNCRANIRTRVEHDISGKTHMIAAALCLIACWPCCLIPYCMDSCKNANHSCPTCGTFIGFYKY